MAPNYKSPQVSHAHVDENSYEDVHEMETVYKTGEADRRDMLRMNKPQEMKVGIPHDPVLRINPCLL